MAALASAAMLYAALPAQAADAWSSLSKTEKLSSYGYFVWKSEHATTQAEKDAAAKAADILKTAPKKDYTSIGAEKDSTSLDNFKAAIEEAQRINDFRSAQADEPCRTDLAAGKGRVCDDANKRLTPLVVTDILTAIAQSNVNYSKLSSNGHAKQYQVGENLSWAGYLTYFDQLAQWYGEEWKNCKTGQSVAACGWYWTEKPLYNADPSDPNAGHYTNLTNKGSDYTYTGVAINSDAPTYGYAVSQVYSYADLDKWNGMTAPTYSVADYSKSVNDYVALANASTKTITSVQDATLDVASGTAKPTNLPSTVTATYDDNTTAQVPVTWDAVPNDWNKDRNAHTVKVTGKVDGWSKDVTLTLNVAAATVTKATLADGSDETSVTTPSGISPDAKLPKTGKVTWSNGDTTDETITWQSSTKDQYGKREGNKYDLTGVIARANVTVTAHVTVTPATVQSVADPAAITVTKGAKPSAIPATAKVTWSNGETTDEPITWDNGKDPNNATFDQLGAQTFTGTAAGKAVTLTVTVVEAKVTKAYDPEDITVVSGTEPKLPATVKADLDNGQTKQDVPVVWTPNAVPESLWKALKGGEQTFTGVVNGQSDQTVTVKVTVTHATITAATVDPATLNTPAGLDPTAKLPKTATITWSNGDTGTADVDWDAIKADQYQTAGTFTVNGTVTAEGQSAKVTLPVTVTAAAAVSAKATADSVDTIATHAPDLSEVNATVTYSNGATTTNTVRWDAIEAGQYANPGTFTVNGTVLDTTVNARAAGDELTGADGKPFTVSVTVNVKARAITAVTPAADTITVDSGTAAPENLVGKAVVAWNDGTTESRDIALTLPEGWNKPHTAHTVEATGRTDGWDKDVTFTVHVNAATIAAVESLPDQSTVEGVVPALPATAKVTWSNGETTSEKIVWDEPENFDELFDKASATPVVVNGEIAGHKDHKVSVKITVTAAVIDKLDPVDGVTVEAGQKPALPATVNAHFSNGTQGAVAVTWKTDGVDFANRTGKDKTVTVKGEVKGYADGTSVTVTVRSATAKTAAVKGDSAITVDSGTDPASKLPKTATVTWSDGGKDAEEDITWEALGKDKWNNRDGGTYTVNGATKTTGLNVSVTVTVNKATVTKVDTADIPVTTTVGVQPKLPETVKVTWSNGDETGATVNWSAINAEQLAQPGTFDVTGTTTVDGTPYTITAKVTVTAATVKNVEKIVDVTTATGKAPKLPETVKVIWSDGTVTDEPATWNDVPATAYAKPGAFQVKGSVTIAGSVYELVANVTVSGNGTLVPQPGADQNQKTDDDLLSKTGSSVAIIIVVAVVLIVIAVIVLIVVKQRKDR